MSKYTEKIDALRREITVEIVALMREHSLDEVKFDEVIIDDPTYVLWQANSGNWHESIVKKVVLSGDGFELYCDDENGSAVLGSAEMSCNRLENLEGVRMNILQHLSLSDETSDIPYTALIARRDQLNQDFRKAITELILSRGEGGRIVFWPEELEEGDDITDYGDDFPVTVTLWGNRSNPYVDITEVFVKPDGPTIYAKGIDDETRCMCNEDFEIFDNQLFEIYWFVMTVLKKQKGSNDSQP